MLSKNLVVLCDGTWKTEHDPALSNIGKTHTELSANPMPDKQLIYYDRGVGTGGFSDGLLGGATGKGLDENIKHAYKFLISYYQPGDNIFLMGFSRGAYTVRSLAGFIRNVGMLKPPVNDGKIAEAMNIYRSTQDANDPWAIKFRTDNSTISVDIHFLGVYDTVGSLGIPDDIFDDSALYRFHNIKLTKTIKTARQALAIDEQRNDFNAVLWEAKKETNSEQRWFVGVHSDIGGGYGNTGLGGGLADIPRDWMLREAAKTGLILPKGYFPSGILDTDPQFVIKPDFNAKLHDSRYFLGNMPLRSNNIRNVFGTSGDETIDPSVWQRIRKDSNYRPKNILKIINRRPVEGNENIIVHARL